ncbi:hypothetical protein ACFL6P_06680, partial [Candidatus Latescibacterota bacterium]
MCGKDKKLVESHIIPRSFIKETQYNDQNIKIYPADNNEYPQKSPIGFYDKELVCEDCEKIFGPWDHYAKELLIDK